MTVHFYPPTGRFLYSEHLVPVGGAKGASITQDLGGTYYDMYSGDLVLANMLVPKLGKTVFPEASLDLNFARNKSLVDDVSGQNLVTFSRASGGRYVDSQGVIRDAVTNLALRSEEFDNASWAKVAITVSANASSAPNGTVTADEVVVNTATSTHSTYCSPVTSSSGTVYTFSCYVKAGTSNYAFVGLTDLTTGGVERRINLSTGVIDTTNISGAGSWTSSSGSVSSVGDGWYRVVVTGTQGGGTSVAGQVFVGSSTGQRFYTGNSTDSVYAWGAQLEQSSTVGEYIPTGATINSAPRFDHNPTTGESLGLLVEESRTNLLLRSEEFDNASWARGGSSITPNATTSPDGLTSADKIVESATLDLHYAFQSISVTAGAVYTLSVYMKAAERTEGALNLAAFNSAFPTNAIAYFNLSTGAVRFSGAGLTSSAIAAFPNGWYRCTITATAQTTTSAIINSGSISNGVTNYYTGDGTSGIYLWGAQLEAGAFPTSYVKTEAATATRSADIAQITGSNFSRWYSQSQGTVLCKTQKAGPVGTSRFPRLFEMSNNTINDVLRAQRYGPGVYRVSVVSGGTTYAAFDATPSVAEGAAGSFALAYALNDIATCVNSGSIATDTSALIPTVTQLNIGDAGSGAAVGPTTNVNGTISRLVYFDRRLGNTTLQAITS